MAERNKTTREAADQLDLGPTTLQNWVRLGCPHDVVKAKHGKSALRFDPDEVAAWMVANGKSGKRGRPAAPESEDLKAAKLRKERAMARKYELEVAEKEGQLIDAAAERQRDLAKIVAVRNRLCGLGATLAPQLEGLSGAERQTLIDEAVEAILKEFGSDKGKAKAE
jgi:phage terminase Nu1 subunit (DNA packaging protein)